MPNCVTGFPRVHIPNFTSHSRQLTTHSRQLTAHSRHFSTDNSQLESKIAATRDSKKTSKYGPRIKSIGKNQGTALAHVGKNKKRSNIRTILAPAPV